MKKILGLDLGTTSIGWALVNEAENNSERSSIIRLGVRVNPLTVDESTNFEEGKPITTNAERMLKRSMRRNLQRYKLRRNNLKELFLQKKFITKETILAEQSNSARFETYHLRAKAVHEEISLEELARVLLMINKKRGYKSSRKANNTEEGALIDGMNVAKELYNQHITPGQYVVNLIKDNKHYIPDFYRSDLQKEFDLIWQRQSEFYPIELTNELYESIQGKNKNQTWAILKEPLHLVGIKRTGKLSEQKIENYSWRAKGILTQLRPEELAIVLQEINGQINQSSGYLGNISDRSKELYFNNQTIGEYLVQLINGNPHQSLKNIVFYRQDYIDEFEKIWSTQAQFHPELTNELKQRIKNEIIFYQRPLKSQKGLVSFCEFENEQIEKEIDGKKKLITIGCKVCPKSSPLFQEFRIWQYLNNVQIKNVTTKECRFLEQEEKEILFNELNYKEKLTASQILKLLGFNAKAFALNYKELVGNRTQATLINTYARILVASGHMEFDFSKLSSQEIVQTLHSIFSTLGINTAILDFNSSIEGKALEQQPYYQLWHLLYSYESDNSTTGNDSLLKALKEHFGFNREYGLILANVIFESDYGNLSAKAIRKILPHLKDGLQYDVACSYAGYKHSRDSLTKEEIENKVLKEKLDILPKNSLRNPVVEKILNQMIHVVNSIKDQYGNFDEVRIEMARELKKSAKEREELTKGIRSANKVNDTLKATIQKEFGLSQVSKNDLIRYKLYLELKDNGYKTLYSNTYISKDKIFSKEFDIEHIIPQAKLFDDSFSNKTLEARSVNIKKGKMTAYDFIKEEYGEEKLNEYIQRVENLFKANVISKTKKEKLLMPEKEIPTDFIDRDLRDSQYIAKKAKQILNELVPVVQSTTGSVTSRLREDWQLVDIMQELNWDKYDKLNMTHYESNKDGKVIPKIDNWTKRNDHRHHAMDALTIAFTKPVYIQYLNNLNARLNKETAYLDKDFNFKELNIRDIDATERSAIMYQIENKYLYRDEHHKSRFIAPIPLSEFRQEAKKQLENVLISIKAKNKVTTQNINHIKTANGTKKVVQLTPRAQLHNETIYGRIQQYETSYVPVGSKMTKEVIQTVANKAERQALLRRLEENNYDPKKAFSGKNSITKNPIYIDECKQICVPSKVKIVQQEERYTIRKAISPDLKIDKVVDKQVRDILTERLANYNGNAKEAFSNLDENPIWLNKEQGIAIKRVKIWGVKNAEALHDKRDFNGQILLGKNGQKQASDFVSPGNNHHIAIYEDKEQVLHEKVVSYFEATARKNLGLPIVDTEYNAQEGWHFLFSMKQNEMFVFPRYEKVINDEGNIEEVCTFDPTQYDEAWFKDPQNYSIISPNLFRVQKITNKDYWFRHHLESSIQTDIKDLTYKRLSNMPINALKVRINHIGQIVSIGEYL